MTKYSIKVIDSKDGSVRYVCQDSSFSYLVERVDKATSYSYSDILEKRDSYRRENSDSLFDIISAMDDTQMDMLICQLNEI